MRFAMRSATRDSAERAGLYATALEMCAWAETRGAAAAVISQHHGVDDGYLPSPVPMAAAIAARTATLPISVAALLLALYEPVKLAEDMSVVDLLSRGRVSYVIGIGYRDEEFALFGVDRRRRAHVVEQRVGILRRLWAGEEVDVDGRRARITPLPFTVGGPMLAYGGGTEAATGAPAGWACSSYRKPTIRASKPPTSTKPVAPGRRRWAAGSRLRASLSPPSSPTTRTGRGPRSATTSSATRPATPPGTPTDRTSHRGRTRRHRRRSAGRARLVPIITPEEAAALVDRGHLLALQPLVGGLPPEIAWRYLEAAAAAVGRPTASSGGSGPRTA